MSDPPSSDGEESSDGDLAESAASDDGRDDLADETAPDDRRPAATSAPEAVGRPAPSASGSRTAHRQLPSVSTARPVSRAEEGSAPAPLARSPPPAPKRDPLPSFPNFKRPSTSTLKNPSGGISSAAAGPAPALVPSPRSALPPFPNFKKIKKPVESDPPVKDSPPPAQSPVPAPDSSLLERAEARAWDLDDYPDAAPPFAPEDAPHIGPSASPFAPPALARPHERARDEIQELVGPDSDDRRSSRTAASPPSPPPLPPTPLPHQEPSFVPRVGVQPLAASACPGWSLRLPEKRSPPSTEDDGPAIIERASKKERLEDDVSVDEGAVQGRRSRWGPPHAASDLAHLPAPAPTSQPSPLVFSTPPFPNRAPLESARWAPPISPDTSAASSSTGKRSHDRALPLAADEALDGRKPAKRPGVVKPSGLRAFVERGHAIDAADAVAQLRAVAAARARKPTVTPSAGRMGAPPSSIGIRPERALPPFDPSLSVVRPSSRSARAPASLCVFRLPSRARRSRVLTLTSSFGFVPTGHTRRPRRPRRPAARPPSASRLPPAAPQHEGRPAGSPAWRAGSPSSAAEPDRSTPHYFSPPAAGQPSPLPHSHPPSPAFLARRRPPCTLCTCARPGSKAS